jgi:hypothetical protein
MFAQLREDEFALSHRRLPKMEDSFSPKQSEIQIDFIGKLKNLLKISKLEEFREKSPDTSGSDPN